MACAMLARAVSYHWWSSCAVICAVALCSIVPAQGSVSTITYFSPSNNRNLSFQVYTPPGYSTDPSREYPVVISLHGIVGTSAQRANLYGPTLDSRINSAEIL